MPCGRDLIKVSQEKTVKLNLIFVCLAIGLVQITPLNAQAVSPAGHYAKKSGGAGEMRVEPTAEGWRVLVTAGGIPRGLLRPQIVR
jgi:hypothetical protein